MVLQAGNIRPVRIDDEMRSAYLDYAMSVIVSRALPDVRDGLKPVQRRILYSMHEMGLRPSSSHKKSAGVVGEVMGKYHPHGDAAIYDALVRMAQGFSMRHPLVDGQGNFGSVDDDPPAAMRYTEARLAHIAEQMLADLDRNTVDFADNYDGSQREPTVLPALLPNLLLNGAGGIAVGMATNIPPHNLSELCGAIVHLVDNPDATIDELMEDVRAPDFPTAGIIMGLEGVKNAYHTGRGRVVVRARATVEQMDKGDRRQILVSELPYQVNKASLVERIATLAKEKKIDGVSEVRDESGREGMRVVIELARGMNPGQVLNNLYKHTAMQSAFHVNMLALVEGQPRVVTLKSALTHYIEFRRTVIQRRAEFDLARARARAHILEGLQVALDNIDAIIELIRNSIDASAARAALMRNYALSETQAQAILDMQLRRLAALERQRIQDELEEVQARISDLEDLLRNPARVLSVVREETLKLSEEYGQDRRTEVSGQEATDFSMEELTPHADVVITLSDRGYLKRLPIETYRLQRRGGKGVRGQETREGDAVQQLVVADTHDWAFFFTDAGRVYRERVFNLPVDGSRQTRGAPVQGIININADERVTAIVAIREPGADKYIVMATRKGEVKRMHLSQFANIRANGLAAMDLEKGDALLTARLADPDMSVIMISRGGKGAQFALDSVRVRQTRSAGGVRGMKLVGNDEVIGMDVAHPDDRLLLLTVKGYGKRTGVSLFRTTERGAQGVIALNITEKTGPMAAAVVISQGVEEVMVGSAKAMVYRTRIEDIRSLGRATQGVKIMTKLRDDDQVISISAFKTGEFEDDETEMPVLDAPKVERRKNGHQKPKRSARAEPEPSEDEEEAEDEVLDEPEDFDEPEAFEEPEAPPARGGQSQLTLDMGAEAEEDE